MGTAQIIMPDNYIALFDTPTTEKIVREAEPDIAKVAREIAAYAYQIFKEKAERTSPEKETEKKSQREM